MLVVRFRVQCRPEKTAEVQAVFEQVIAPSRAVEGVITFDIGRDLADPTVFIATEVFVDRNAFERQSALPEVAMTMAVLGESVAAPPEATLYEVMSTEQRTV